MIKISIIIVNYKLEEKLFNCLNSIYRFGPNVSFEVILVDNSEENNIQKQLKRKFPNVVYINKFKNVGFGAGNNLGAYQAKGEFLFFLNPDTIVEKNSINSLYYFAKSNKNVGIVSPLIVDDKGNVFSLQGYGELTPLNSIYSFSFLKKMIPDKTIFKNYSLKEWDKQRIREVKTVYGAALMIKASLFKKIKGFDEDYFLYFEENDISKRVRNLGYKLYINSNAKVFHSVAQSTKKLKTSNKFFLKSRFLYLKKHFGLLEALIAESFLRVDKTSIAITLVLLIALFLRVYNLNLSMPFIGDQGWFYLSARDMLLTGKIPLVGITSSHTWLHQGPLWTYILSIGLLLFNFNPLSGAYITALFGVGTVYLMYKLGSEMFSKNTGIIASALYAVSPLIVFFDRMPFDPSPIPFFTLLYFYLLFKWIRGNVIFFPVILLTLAVLYNLELATFALSFPFVLILVFGLIKSKKFVSKTINRKIVSLSFISVLIPMLPVLIYDLNNGFKQTIVFLGWTLYKPFSFLINNSQVVTESNSIIFIEFLFSNIQKIIFQANLAFSLLIVILSIIYLIYYVLKTKKELADSKFLLLVVLLFSLSGILINRVPSDAYLSIIFPFLIFTIALFINFVIKLEKLKYLIFLILMIIIFSNVYYSYINSFNSSYIKRVNATDEIIKLVDNQKYNLVGRGQGSEFESFTMNYEYILWWKGHPISKNNENIKVYLSEDSQGIHIIKK